MFSSGSQLAQVRPANTSTATAYTAVMPTEITRIVVCNTTGSAATFSIFHDDDGTTYSEATALYFAQSLAANTTLVIEMQPGTGLMLRKNTATATIGVQSGTNNAITYTFYGVTTITS